VYYKYIRKIFIGTNDIWYNVNNLLTNILYIMMNRNQGDTCCPSHASVAIEKLCQTVTHVPLSIHMH